MQALKRQAAKIHELAKEARFGGRQARIDTEDRRGQAAREVPHAVWQRVQSNPTACKYKTSLMPSCSSDTLLLQRQWLVVHGSPALSNKAATDEDCSSGDNHIICVQWPEGFVVTKGVVGSMSIKLLG